MTDRFTLRHISETASDVLNQHGVVVGHMASIRGRDFLWISPCLDVDDLLTLARMLQTRAIDARIDLEYGS